jgi:hypothetical protein
MTNCRLENEINHSNVKQDFRDTTVPCLLFERKGAMSSLGTVCSACCLAVNTILAELRRPAFIEPGLNPDLIPKKIEENRENTIKSLSPQLRKYYEIVPKISKKDWDTISHECSRCPVNSDMSTGLDASIQATEAQPM